MQKVDFYQKSHLSETIMKGDTIMNTTNQTEQELMNYISAHKILNTHSHHLPEQAMTDFNLNKLIGSSYLQWQQVTPGTTAESRSVFLEKMRYRSFFVWLQKAIQELYGISDPITPQNWDQISDLIHKAHQNPSLCPLRDHRDLPCYLQILL